MFLRFYRFWLRFERSGFEFDYFGLEFNVTLFTSGISSVAVCMRLVVLGKGFVDLGLSLVVSG